MKYVNICSFVSYIWCVYVSRVFDICIVELCLSSVMQRRYVYIIVCNYVFVQFGLFMDWHLYDESLCWLVHDCVFVIFTWWLNRMATYLIVGRWCFLKLLSQCFHFEACWCWLRFSIWSMTGVSLHGYDLPWMCVNRLSLRERLDCVQRNARVCYILRIVDLNCICI